MGQIGQVLVERGQRYGRFMDHAEITQALKHIMTGSDKSTLCDKTKARIRSRVELMQPDQIECLDMIAHKIGRILNGDPNYDDSWVDVAGYTTLVVDRLKGTEEA